MGGVKLFATLADPDSAAEPVSSTLGAFSLRFAGDVRSVPFNVRYGLTHRFTVFATIPLERSGTVVFGPYFAGATLGLNPNATTNRRVLAAVGARFGDLGGALLLPTAGSAEGIELQGRQQGPFDRAVVAGGTGGDGQGVLT